MKFTVQTCAVLAVLGSATAFSLSMMASSNGKVNSNNPQLQKIDVSRRTLLQTAGVAAVGGVVGTKTAKAADSINDEENGNSNADGFTTTESGLQYKILQEGSGAIPSVGQTVKAHYTGWLNGFDSMKKFDSSRDRGRPFTFAVGKGQVIRGWDESFSSMKVGERRQIILPARLAYGDRGAGGLIPGGATLYFDVELLGIL